MISLTRNIVCSLPLSLAHVEDLGEGEDMGKEEEDNNEDAEAEAGYDTDSSVTIHGQSVITEF